MTLIKWLRWQFPVINVVVTFISSWWWNWQLKMFHSKFGHFPQNAGLEWVGEVTNWPWAARFHVGRLRSGHSTTETLTSEKFPFRPSSSTEVERGGERWREGRRRRERECVFVCVRGERGKERSFTQCSQLWWKSFLAQTVGQLVCVCVQV